MTTLDGVAKDIGEALVPETGPFGTLTRRMGVVAALPSGTPPTVTVTVGGVAIPKVRLLGPSNPIVGDVVVVDFNGPDPLLIGKLASLGAMTPSEGQLVTSPAIELYHPSGTPYIDFHAGASPAADSNADFAGRLIYSTTTAGNRLGVQGASGFPEVNVGAARCGFSPSGAYGNAFASWDHVSRSYNSPGNYVLLADLTDTYVNATATGTVHLRVNNVDGLQVVHSGIGPVLIGSAIGFNGTVPECKAGGPIFGSGIFPNYVIQGGSAVPTFSGGNATFTWPLAMGAIYTVVVSEGGGLSDTVLGTQNYGGSGTGVYAIHGGAPVSGLVRVNFMVIGS